MKITTLGRFLRRHLVGEETNSAIGCIVRLMANLDPERTLIPRERKDGTWCVKAEKPDRIIQHIGDFNNEAEAQDWINHESNAYFDELPSWSLPRRTKGT